MHGEGAYSIGSTYTYRTGMLINGLPAGWPFRLSVNNTDKSSPFVLKESNTTLTVDIIDSSENENRIETESGRLIRLRCGQRTDEPTNESLPTPLYVFL